MSKSSSVVCDGCGRTVTAAAPGAGELSYAEPREFVGWLSLTLTRIVVDSVSPEVAKMRRAVARMPEETREAAGAYMEAVGAELAAPCYPRTESSTRDYCPPLWHPHHSRARRSGAAQGA